MKKSTFALVALIAIALNSCGIMGGSSQAQSSQSSQPAATAAVTSPSSTQGQTAGKSLKSLYAQYKADGTFDLKNMNNLLSLMQLMGSCQDLKTNAKESDYWSGFAKGLILGSENLVNESNANIVTEKLSEMASQTDTSKWQQASGDATSAISSMGEAYNSLSSLFSLFK